MITNQMILRLAAGTGLMALAACGGADKKTETATVNTATVETAPIETTAPDAAPVASPVVAPASAAPGAMMLASFTGDAVKGEKVFGQCKTCHVAEKGVNRVGPSLWGIIGRPAGSIQGFKYSPANKNSGLVWAPEQLFTYLEAPQKVIKGTYMAFAGLKNPQDRADVIAYLKTRA